MPERKLRVNSLSLSARTDDDCRLVLQDARSVFFRRTGGVLLMPESAPSSLSANSLAHLLCRHAALERDVLLLQLCLTIFSLPRLFAPSSGLCTAALCSSSCPSCYQLDIHFVPVLFLLLLPRDSHSDAFAAEIHTHRQARK